MPTVTSLASVDSFRVLRTSGLLGGGAAPYQYVEVIEVNDLGRLRGELGSETIQQIAAEFQQFAESPIFMLADQFAFGEAR